MNIVPTQTIKPMLYHYSNTLFIDWSSYNIMSPQLSTAICAHIPLLWNIEQVQALRTKIARVVFGRSPITRQIEKISHQRPKFTKKLFSAPEANTSYINPFLVEDHFFPPPVEHLLICHDHHHQSVGRSPKSFTSITNVSLLLATLKRFCIVGNVPLKWFIFHYNSFPVEINLS